MRHTCLDDSYRQEKKVAAGCDDNSRPMVFSSSTTNTCDDDHHTGISDGSCVCVCDQTAITPRNLYFLVQMSMCFSESFCGGGGFLLIPSGRASQAWQIRVLRAHQEERENKVVSTRYPFRTNFSKGNWKKRRSSPFFFRSLASTRNHLGIVNMLDNG